MQDSLEDFIKISKNTKKEEPVNITKEFIVTAQVKKECEVKALQIVQFALEGRLRPEALSRCLPFINQSHYQDIVEERAITKQCGYPLCCKKIPEMPQKKYFISVKSNKVYDITERKNYCSNYCYKASLHIKKQVDDSPLWLRNHKEIPRFSLLAKSDRGTPGELIDQGIAKPASEPCFTSINNFAQMSLDEAEESEVKVEEKPKTELKRPKKYKKKLMKTINESEEYEQSVTVKVDKKEAPEIDIEELIMKCCKEWFTLETVVFVHGEEKLREKLDATKLNSYLKNIQLSEMQLEQQKKYIDICRRLHLKDLADEKFDNAIIGRSLQTIPDYNCAREESIKMDLKVRSFYGSTEAEAKTEVVEEGPPAVLPLVEVNTQNAMRRKIFLNSLNRIMQVLLQNLKISQSQVLPDLLLLVKTFKLKADNIVFKPKVWNYIAVILLKILFTREGVEKELLEEPKSRQLLDLYLNSLPNKGMIVENVLKTVQDIDAFVEGYLRE